MENNTHLQTFMTNECNAITNNTLLTIGKSAKNIEELSIQMNDRITSESLDSLTSLKTLVIRKYKITQVDVGDSDRNSLLKVYQN